LVVRTVDLLDRFRNQHHVQRYFCFHERVLLLVLDQHLRGRRGTLRFYLCIGKGLQICRLSSEVLLFHLTGVHIGCACSLHATR
jgi:hypothetical protein